MKSGTGHGDPGVRPAKHGEEPRPLRVVMLLHQLPPTPTGGTELYALHLAAELVREGHRVVMYAPAGSPELREDSWRVDGWEGPVSVPIVYGPGKAVRAGGESLTERWRQFATTLGNREALAALEEVLKREQPDILHIHHLLGTGPEAIDLAEGMGLKTVMTLHDFFTLCPRGTLLDRSLANCSGPRMGSRCASCVGPVRYGGLGRAASPLAIPLLTWRTVAFQRRLVKLDRLIAPSRFVEEVYISHGVLPPRLRYLPYGIPGPKGGTAIQGAAWRPGTPLRVGFIGGAHPPKGLDILAAALAELSPDRYRLEVFGGSTGEEYAAVVGGLPRSSVSINGPFDPADRGTVFAGMDLLVVPSRWRETGPMVIHEAHAHGVPVVAAALGGMAERVRHGTDGLLFSHSDPGSLAACLRRLVEEPTLDSRLRHGCGLYPEIGPAAMEVLRIYREVLADQDHGRKLADPLERADGKRHAALRSVRATPSHPAFSRSGPVGWDAPGRDAIRRHARRLRISQGEDQGLLTLAIPSFNSARYLRTTLEAVFRQSRAPDRVIVVDDGSTDETPFLLSTYPVEVVRHGTPLGIAATRNSAFRRTRTPLLLFVDADAAPDPESVEQIIAEMMVDETIAGLGGRGIDLPHSDEDHWRALYHRQSFGPDRIDPAPFLMGLCCAYRTEALRAVDGFDPRFVTNGEDIDIGYRLSGAGHRLVYNPRIRVQHLRRDGPVSLLRMATRHGHGQTTAHRVNHAPYHHFAVAALRRAMTVSLTSAALRGPKMGLLNVAAQLFTAAGALRAWVD